MAAEFSGSPYTLSVVVETDEQITDFGRYVAAIDDSGGVVFQGSLAQGGSGVFRVDDGPVRTVAVAASGSFQTICSHPDADGAGRTCFYAESADGVAQLFASGDGQIGRLSEAAGPLGPTVNRSGIIAFRAPLRNGGSGIFTCDRGIITTIADTNGEFGEFHGLPVIDGAGRVVFRADRRDGTEGVYAGRCEDVVTIAESGDRFRRFGFFPFANDAGVVVFCAELRSGVTGVFAASAGSISTLVDTESSFQSFRGALLSAAGKLVFYGTRHGAELGIYTGLDPDRDCLLAVGRPLFGSIVADFALNPVSINDAGQLAIRVALESGRQLILRADP